MLKKRLEILKNYLQMPKLVQQENIRKITDFSYLLIIIVIIDGLFFKQSNFWFDRSTIFLLTMPLIYLLFIKPIFRKEKITVYIYIVMLILVSVFFFYTLNIYYLIPLILLMSVGPLLNLKQTIILLVISLIINITKLVFNNLFIEDVKHVILIYIFVLLYSQILYINYLKNLYDKHLLHEKNKILLSQADTDELTGLLNRYGMQNKINQLINLKDNSMKCSAIFLLDIDYFKNYNDTFGHLEGDKCLKKIANILKSSIKSELDFVARFGGEEFILFINNVNEKQAIEIGKRACKNIYNQKIKAPNNSKYPFVTISLGIATYNLNSKFDFFKLIEEADKQLYLVKKEGKNALALKDKIYYND